MKLAIVGPSLEKAGYSSERLFEEAKKIFKEVAWVPAFETKLRIDKKGLDAVHGKTSLSKFDYILPRIDSKRAAIGYPILGVLDHMGVRKPYSAETILIAHNKFVTLNHLANKGVRVPRTWLTGSKKSAKEILSKEGLPIVMKLLSGFGGMGVMVMESREAAESSIETMRTLQQEICLEEFIKNPGEDFRGIVAGDEVIASFRRVAAPGEARANVKIGGKAVAYKLPGEMEEIVFKSAEAIGSKICAVDMLRDKKGETFVIEVNINPGLKGMEAATNINVSQRMVEYIRNELKK
jgi:ribosomal protein S6--L-glutamate ligase